MFGMVKRGQVLDIPEVSLASIRENGDFEPMREPPVPGWPDETPPVPYDRKRSPLLKIKWEGTALDLIRSLGRLSRKELQLAVEDMHLIGFPRLERDRGIALRGQSEDYLLFMSRRAGWWKP